jgi:hypothetical protein
MHKYAAQYFQGFQRQISISILLKNMKNIDIISSPDILQVREINIAILQ